MIRTKRILTSFAIALFYFSSLTAQSLEGSDLSTDNKLETSSKFKVKVRELKIGDIVPDIDFQMLNYSCTTAKLKDFRGKLVILDFWATWCAPCIKQLSKLDSLQKRFQDDLQILLVSSGTNDQELQRIKSFFAKRQAVTGSLSLPSVINDTVAVKMFPFRILPHYVVISKSGIVQAMTSSGEINEQNIRRLIDGTSINLRVKKDIDENNPLFLNEDIKLADISQYSIFLKGKIDGLPAGIKTRKQGNVVRGIAITNTPILWMYEVAIKQLLPSYNQKQLILEVADSLMIGVKRVSQLTNKDAWYINNFYTYELVVPLSKTDSLYQYIIDDLNRYTNYYGSIEKRSLTCLQLVRISAEDKIKTRGNKSENKLYLLEKSFLRNASVSLLVSKLNNVPSIRLIVVDHTNYSGKIDIMLNGFNSLDAIRKDLQSYGLDLQETKLDFDVFVLKESIDKKK